VFRAVFGGWSRSEMALRVWRFLSARVVQSHLSCDPGGFVAFSGGTMVYVERIESLDLPELAPYRTMRRQVEHRREGIFVAESDKVVRRLLESDFTVVSLLLPEKWARHFEPVLARRMEEITVYIMEKEQLETLTGFSFYQGVLAVGKVPEAPSLDQLVAACSHPQLFVAVEGVTNAENLGGMVRNCAAFGVQGLLIDRSTSSPFLRRAVRGSMGTIFRLPVLENLDLVQTVRFLRSRSIRCVAAHPHDAGRKLPEVGFSGDCCIIFGSEGYGLSSELLEACDEAVAIPMMPGVDSLNVGSAAAVFLYEASCSRSHQPAGGLAGSEPRRAGASFVS
jgi:tRNA G18 (ribose-2'-O)-methylase SpoU